MMALLLVLALGQSPRCDESATLLTSAAGRLAAFDTDGAIAQLSRVPADCADARVQFWYLRGLASAKDAYRYGGSIESLEPVRRAVNELSALAGRAAAAEAARVVLLAASAAAQSEREELGLLLDQARYLGERLPGEGLIIPVHDIAGDLWLQVHRFEDARRAYAEAARLRGSQRRVRLGLARVAVRLGEVSTACAEYRNLVAAWSFPAEPPEIIEARAFLGRPDCQARPTPARR